MLFSFAGKTHCPLLRSTFTGEHKACCPRWKKYCRRHDIAFIASFRRFVTILLKRIANLRCYTKLRPNLDNVTTVDMIRYKPPMNREWFG